MEILKRGTGLAAYCVCLFLLIEGILRLIAWAYPPSRVVLDLSNALKVSPTVEDRILGLRPNPSHPQHDRNGFRNPRRLKRAEIVVLGDSWTYGTSVAPSEAWPAQLVDLTNRTVYNMGYGSWGAIHHLALLPEALALKPKILLVALYFGSDLFDSYERVYQDQEFEAFQTHDAEVRTLIAGLRSEQPLLEKIKKNTEIREDLERQSRAEKTLRPESGIKTILLKFRFFHLIRTFKWTIEGTMHENAIAGGEAQGSKEQWQQQRVREERHPDIYDFFESGPIRTVFLPPLRLLALDSEDPRIQEGFRITVQAVRAIRDRTRQSGIRMILLLLPTKELAFEKLASESPNPQSRLYLRLVESESHWRNRLRETLSNQGMEFLDLLEVFQKALARNEEIFFMSENGHPNAAGQRFIAQEVAKHLS